jgi:hypothetical protein
MGENAPLEQIINRGRVLVGKLKQMTLSAMVTTSESEISARDGLSLGSSDRVHSTGDLALMNGGLSCNWSVRPPLGYVHPTRIDPSLSGFVS